MDLIFFNRLLYCFVFFHSKIGRFKHQDIGQMQRYMNYYERKVKLEDKNPTIGIFASKYLTVSPSKEKLKKLMESEE